MIWLKNISFFLVVLASNVSPSAIPEKDVFPDPDTDPSFSNKIDADLLPDDALGSPNYFTSESFDSFPDLSFFPEFEEVFRISRTTTQRPPFRFPTYVRDPFTGSGSRTRRPRRPPRPSGSRTKISKHHPSKPEISELKEKNRKSNKGYPPKTFPKIFRFTSDRVNLADFDSKKKVNENYLALTKGDELDSDRVKRNEFLILHGGVFEIESKGSNFGR